MPTPSMRPDDRKHAAPGRIARGTSGYRRLSLALLMAGCSTFALLYDVQPLLSLYASSYQVNAAEASLAGSAIGGLAWSWAAWPAIISFAGALTLSALAVAVRLAGVPPRDESAGAAA